MPCSSSCPVPPAGPKRAGATTPRPSRRGSREAADAAGDSSWPAAGPTPGARRQRTESGHATWRREGLWRAPGGCRPAGGSEHRQRPEGQDAHGRRRRCSERAEGRPRGAVPAVGWRLLLPRASFSRLGPGRALALVLAHLSPGSFPSFYPPLSPSSFGAPKWRRRGRIT